jgi:hypothetical protein
MRASRPFGNNCWRSYVRSVDEDVHRFLVGVTGSPRWCPHLARVT